jgi:hypothetical protein
MFSGVHTQVKMQRTASFNVAINCRWKGTNAQMLKYNSTSPLKKQVFFTKSYIDEKCNIKCERVYPTFSHLFFWNGGVKA